MRIPVLEVALQIYYISAAVHKFTSEIYIIYQQQCINLRAVQQFNLSTRSVFASVCFVFATTKARPPFQRKKSDNRRLKEAEDISVSAKYEAPLSTNSRKKTF